MANYRLREDVTDAQLQKGREAALKRAGFVVFHDYLETLKETLTPEQIGIIIIALGEYAKSGNEKTLDDPAVHMAYKMGINGLNRDVEKYATTCANHSASALEREAKKRKQTKDSKDIPKEKPPDEKSPSSPRIPWTDDMTFKAALNKDTAKYVLQEYAKQHDLWIPPDSVCRYMSQSQYQKPFLNHSLHEVHGFLQKHLQDETCEEAIDNIFERIRMQTSKAQL